MDLSKLGGIPLGDMPPISHYVFALDGAAGSGKTHFLLNAEKPLAVIDFNRGIKRVLGHIKDKEDILIFEQSMPEFNPSPGKRPKAKEGDFPPEMKKNMEKYGDVAHKALSIYRELLESPVRTIALDTATEFYHVFRLSYFGKLVEVPPTAYSTVNTMFHQVLRMASDYGKNLILSHNMKAKYVGNKDTGRLQRDGYTGTSHDCDLVCNMKMTDIGPKLTLTNCKVNPRLTGSELSGWDVCTYATLMELIKS